MSCTSFPVVFITTTTLIPFQFMTATVGLDMVQTILGEEFDIDELRDIAEHGMSAGVSGFIYYRETSAKFDDNDDEIQDFLSDWYYDCIGGDEGSFAYFARQCEDITQLKNKLVWAYVELKAQSILQQLDD